MKPAMFKEASKMWKSYSKEIEDTEFADLKFELEVHKKLLNLFHVGDYYYYVFNLKKSGTDMISSGFNKMLGYNSEDFNVPFFLDKVHPEDQPWLLNFEHKGIEFFSTLTGEQTLNYKVSYDFRIRKTNGEYVRLLQQTVGIQLTEGRLLRTLGVHTDISHIKPSGLPTLSFIGLNGLPSYINVDVNKIFTPSHAIFTAREKEVLQLLIEGNDSKSIAEALHISVQTVLSHRKNLLYKAETSNTAELVSTAIRNGWI